MKQNTQRVYNFNKSKKLWFLLKSYIYELGPPCVKKIILVDTQCFLSIELR